MEIGFNAATPSAAFQDSCETGGVEILSELSRATTAYHEAAPDRFEVARQEYLEAVRKFNLSQDA